MTPRLLLANISTLILSACTDTSISGDTAPVWVDLFDGETLNGWIVKIAGEPLGEDAAGIFAVGDGVIRVSYDPDMPFAGRFGHLFYEKPLTHYRIRLDYRFIGEQAPGGPDWAYLNSGLMLHAQAPTSLLVDQPFPVAVEAQFLGRSDVLPVRNTGNVCTPGTHIAIDGVLVTEHCITSSTPAALRGKWVQFEAEVRGDNLVRLFIDDNLAFEMTDLQYDPSDADTAALIGNGLALSSGYIALQAESHPVEFRNIRLLELNED